MLALITFEILSKLSKPLDMICISCEPAQYFNKMDWQRRNAIANLLPLMQQQLLRYLAPDILVIHLGTSDLVSLNEKVLGDMIITDLNSTYISEHFVVKPHSLVHDNVGFPRIN